MDQVANPQKQETTPTDDSRPWLWVLSGLKEWSEKAKTTAEPINNRPFVKTEEA